MTPHREQARRRPRPSPFEAVLVQLALTRAAYVAYARRARRPLARWFALARKTGPRDAEATSRAMLSRDVHPAIGALAAAWDRDDRARGLMHENMNRQGGHTCPSHATSCSAPRFATAAFAMAKRRRRRPAKPTTSIARGRYIAKIAGCNDCHTAGYAPSGGKVPEKDWLQGDMLGWKGDWGTTYAVNLRTYMQGMTEDQWVKIARRR